MMVKALLGAMWCNGQRRPAAGTADTEAEECVNGINKRRKSTPRASRGRNLVRGGINWKVPDCANGIARQPQNQIN